MVKVKPQNEITGNYIEGTGSPFFGIKFTEGYIRAYLDDKVTFNQLKSMIKGSKKDTVLRILGKHYIDYGDNIRYKELQNKLNEL